MADARTSSVVVTASKDLMDQIDGVIAELDPNPANQKTVAIFPLQNAEPSDALQVLQDIFQKNTSVNNRNTQNQNNTLQNRSTTQSQQMNNNSRTSSNRGGGNNRTSGF